MDLLDSQISGDYLLRLVPSLLAESDNRLEVATGLILRLQASLDDASVSRSILRLLCSHCSGESFLVDLLVDLIPLYQEPVHIINLMSVAAADISGDKIQKILDAYRELVVHDRRLLVPAIGSISELNLSKQQKSSFFGLVKEALAIVHESDVPTVVQALLHITDSNSAKRTIHDIRKEASRIPISIATLLVDPMASAICCRPEISKAYWDDLKMARDCVPLDVLLMATLLQNISTKQAAIRAFSLLAEKCPSSITLICETVASPQAGPTVFNLFRLVLHTSMGLNQACISQPSRACYETLTTWLQPLAISLFRNSDGVRQPLINSLLAACSIGTKGSERGAVAAAISLSSLAAIHGDEMRPVAHLVLQFLAQHACKCTTTALRHLAAASVCLASGERADQLIVLIQKQLGQLRHGSQRPGLVLASQLLAASCVRHQRLLTGDGAEAVLRSVLRLPLMPQWRFSPLVCAALTAAAPAMGREQVAAILRSHLRPAACQAGVIRMAGSDHLAGGESPRVEITLAAFADACFSPSHAAAACDLKLRVGAAEAGSGRPGGWDTSVCERMAAAAALVSAVLLFEARAAPDADGAGGVGRVAVAAVAACSATSRHRSRAVAEEGDEEGEWRADGGEEEPSDEEGTRKRRVGVKRRALGAEKSVDDVDMAGAWSCWLHYAVAAGCASAAHVGPASTGPREADTDSATLMEQAAGWRVRLARKIGGLLDKSTGGEGGGTGFGGVSGTVARLERAAGEGEGLGGSLAEPFCAAEAGAQAADGLLRLCRCLDCGVDVHAAAAASCLPRMAVTEASLPVVAEVTPPPPLLRRARPRPRPRWRRRWCEWPREDSALGRAAGVGVGGECSKA